MHGNFKNGLRTKFYVYKSNFDVICGKAVEFYIAV